LRQHEPFSAVPVAAPNRVHTRTLDRWVKELRLAKAKTCEHANAVLEKLVPDRTPPGYIPA